MLRFILVAVLIGVALSDAYKTKLSRHRPEKQEVTTAEPPIYDYDYDYDFGYPPYGKDSEGDTNPTIFSYWNNLLKKARIPNFNITNPFSKLFNPYVVKVDFPPGTDPSVDHKPTRKSNKKKKGTKNKYVYLNVDDEDPQFFFDPVTQQYYELHDTHSQNYNPENNYFATTFHDDEEILLDIKNKKQEKNYDYGHRLVYKEEEDDKEEEEDDEEGEEDYDDAAILVDQRQPGYIN